MFGCQINTIKERTRPPQIDLYSEFSTAVRAFGKDSLHALVSRYAVQPKTRFHCPGGAIGLCHVETDGDLYQPTDNHRSDNRALIMATAILTGARLEDLIAFRPADPGKWWLRYGTARWVGEWELARRMITRPLHIEAPALAEPCRTERPLHVFSNPLEWLRNDGDGCVPLASEAVADFIHVQTPLVYESLAHKRQVEASMRFPGQLPDALIRVAEGDMAA